jgi:hypothetical protein
VCDPKASSSICSAGGGRGGDDRLKLILATAPAAFSSLDARGPGGARLLGPPRDQRPCLAAAAFAVVTAAEAAVARASGKDAVGAVGPLSAQALAFCSPPGQRGCGSTWSLAAALAALKASPRLLLDRCLPFTGADVATPAASRAACAPAARRCEDASPVAVAGAWDYRPLQQLWEVQAWIREHGAVVTRMDLMSDFQPFFAAGAGAGGGEVYEPGPGAKALGAHAVLLVGYNNAEGYWVARCVGQEGRGVGGGAAGLEGRVDREPELHARRAPADPVIASQTAPGDTFPRRPPPRRNSWGPVFADNGNFKV